MKEYWDKLLAQINEMDRVVNENEISSKARAPFDHFDNHQN